MLKNNTPAFAANAPTDPAGAAERSAYQGSMLFTANRTAETDTWRSGLNNNVLVLGSSGCGKTRNHLKPNLLQAQGSYIVLDSKGILYRRNGPVPAQHKVTKWTSLDFVGMNGDAGVQPASTTSDGARRASRSSRTSSRSPARCCLARRPRATTRSGRARRRTTSDQLHRLRASRRCPSADRTMAVGGARVRCRRAPGNAEASVRRAGQRRNPGSYAASLRRRAQGATVSAPSKHAREHRGHHRGEPAAAGRSTGRHAPPTQGPRRVDFRELGREAAARCSSTMDDMDTSLAPPDQPFHPPSVLVPVRCRRPRAAPAGACPCRFGCMLDDFANLDAARASTTCLSVIAQPRGQLHHRLPNGQPAGGALRPGRRRTRSSATATISWSWGFRTRRRRAISACARTNPPQVCLPRRPIAGGCSSAGMRPCATRPTSWSGIRVTPTLRPAGRPSRVPTLRKMWLDDIDQEFFDFEELGPEDLELFGDANAA